MIFRRLCAVAVFAFVVFAVCPLAHYVPILSNPTLNADGVHPVPSPIPPGPRGVSFAQHTRTLSADGVQPVPPPSPIPPGLIVYTEYLAANAPASRDAQIDFRQQTERAQRVLSPILPPSDFFALAGAVDGSCDWEKIPQLVEVYLSGLEDARIAIRDDLALQFLPAAAFGGAHKPGDTFNVSASEAIRKLSKEQRDLLHAYLNSQAEQLNLNSQLRLRFPHALQN